MKKIAALITIAATSLVGAKAFAATPAQATPSGGFAGYARAGGLEVNLGGGSLRQIPCAPGAQPGTACYLAR